MRYLLSLFALMLAFSAVCSQPTAVVAQDKGSAGYAEDPMWMWKKKGGWWTTKTEMTKPMAMTTYMKYEITDFGNDECTYTLTMLDKDMKETFSQKDQKLKTKHDSTPSKDGPKVEAPKTSEEEVECKAWGKVKATKIEATYGESKSTTWMVKGCMVKMTNTGGGSEMSMELWETNFTKDGELTNATSTSGGSSTSSSSSSSNAADEWMTPYKKKGNYWTTKTTTTKPMEMVSYMKFEITDVTDKEATYTMYAYDKDMKETYKMEDQKIPLVSYEAPKDSPAVEAPKGTEEEVECKAWGKVKAMRYDYESGGYKSSSWMVKGVCVKASTTGEGVETVSELWETNLTK
ncbi:MAG: hypothetical protein IT462_05355 [Planctomycetes bacterium]|nr:hypothetical protein [Planctomycetota bacterium]